MSPHEGTTGPSLDLDLQKPRLLSPPSQVEGLAEGGASPLRPTPTSPPTQHRWDGPEMHLRDSTHLCNRFQSHPPIQAVLCLPITLLKYYHSLTSLALPNTAFSLRFQPSLETRPQ